MHLKSLALKGFKSFPERTRLDFGPGVSVVVGPNGSGKSNVTDAVLWAMGEQSPLAVRGQSMQDVIFGGGRGVQARNAAEVEIVLDNSDGTLEVPLSEISIIRRLDRTGEGGYRLNGARARLSDVIEVLSDTGLGKETHSVISQGRVEQIVTSRPRERRLLIEEAAGLGKHRKRRRRAQLKLERTQENLDRALDIEREARTRLRPLKRQSEAAELHERLERQSLQAQLELARDAARTHRIGLEEALGRVSQTHALRAQVESELERIGQRRAQAESALAERVERHEGLARRTYAARSALERLALRSEQVGSCAQALGRRIDRTEHELRAPDGHALHEADDQRERRGAVDGGLERLGGEDRIAALQSQLDELAVLRERELAAELEGLLEASERDRERVQQLEEELQSARKARVRADQMVERARAGSAWSSTWQEVRRVIEEGVRRVLAQGDESSRLRAAGEVAAEAESVARGVVEYALKGVRAAEEVREQAESALREAERRHAAADEQLRRKQWLVEQRRAASEQGPFAVRRAQLDGELTAARLEAEQRERRRSERLQALERGRAQQQADRALLALCERLAGALSRTRDGAQMRLAEFERELAGDRAAGEEMAAELSGCAAEEAEIQARLRDASEQVTAAELAAQRVRDQAGEAEAEWTRIAERLGIDSAERDVLGEPGGPPADAMEEEHRRTLITRVERLTRRREQLGPVNPLAQDEYAEALARVEEMEGRRADTETALRELRAVIRDTDRRIHETFEQTFSAAAANFEQLAAEVFPGGSGRLRLVSDDQGPRSVLGGQALREQGSENGSAGPSRSQAAVIGGAASSAHEPEDGDPGAEAEGAGVEEDRDERREEGLLGVEIEITPAGKTTKRLSLLSGGEKSMTALAFLFAVFLARPCPFYILDEVEAALDDLNLDRFLALLRRYSDRAQFIVITHQKRTMEAADWLYGVSMGADGVSKVLSRRLPAESAPAPGVSEVAEVA